MVKHFTCIISFNPHNSTMIKNAAINAGDVNTADPWNTH